MHAKFPSYDYDDMVAAHHLLLTRGLGVETPLGPIRVRRRRRGVVNTRTNAVVRDLCPPRDTRQLIKVTDR